MSAKLRAGVIGAGWMARNHIYGYLTSGRYEVTALADLSEPPMRLADETFGLATKHYQDGRAMLDKENLDVVSVCVSHKGHAPWTVAAAARRPKAILCEKPMAESLGRAEEMLVACQRNGVKLAIGHQRRFLPSYTMARDLIAQGAIGKVEFMVCFAADGLPNYSSHQTDMFRYLLGDDECEWVMGNVERKTDRYERNTRIEDCAVGTFGFKSGPRASILEGVTPTVYQGAQIYGGDGIIRLTTMDCDLLNARSGGWQPNKPEGKFCTLAEGGDRFDWKESAIAQAVELADWVEGKVSSHRGCGESGYKALEMLMAVYESARRHEKVVLPLQTRLNPLDVMIDSGHLEVERPGRYDIRARLLHGEEMQDDGATRGAIS